MVLTEIINKLELLADPLLAEEWDHVGLMVGRRNSNIKKVMVVLDVTNEVVDYAVDSDVDLIISHHPFIFSPVDSITEDTVIGENILELIENDIAVYSMHTNFDSCVMGELVGQILGLQNMSPLEPIPNTDFGIGMVGDVDKCTVASLALELKEELGIDGIRIYGSEELCVESVAILPGSGKGFWKKAYDAGADVFITGDLGHHECLDATQMGLSIIDATHFGLEKVFINCIEEYLLKEFGGQLLIDDYEQEAPYSVI